MTKYLLLFALLFSSLIFPQTVTINEPQTKYTVRHYYGASPDFSYYQFNSAHDLGNYNEAQNRWMDWVSCYKVSLDGVPSGYTIKSIKLTAYITQEEYTPNNFVANVNKLPNNTDLSTASSNAEPLFNSISLANTSIGSFDYGDTLSQDITSSVTSSDFADNYIIVGVYSSASSNNSMAKISISLAVTYYLPVTFTVDNNFVDNSGNGTHGQVSIDGTTQTVPSSGVSLTRNVGQNLTLSAISPQQDNQAYQRTWHTGAISTSDWTRNGASRSPNQTYSFAVATDGGGKTYTANLRKVYNLTFTSSGGTVYVVGSGSHSSPYTAEVVEQNSIYAYAYGYSSNGLDYSFSYWDNNPNSNNITASAHTTYTAVYIGKPSNAGKNFAFNGDIGDPINITWTDNQDSNVTQYQIWRRVKHNGILEDATVLATISRGVQSYTDDYCFTDGYTYDMLSYDVRAYYEPDGTYSDPQWNIAYGEPFASVNENSISMQTKADEVPAEYSITNYPNPFNPTTTINYQLPENGFVTIKVYDMLGKEVATLVDGNRTAGYHNVTFDASRLTSGIYIYTITANNFVQSKKMLLMK